MFRFPEKIGFIGCQQIHGHLKLRRLGFIFQNGNVISKPAQFQFLYARRQARMNERFFGVAVRQPSRLVHEVGDLLELPIAESHGRHGYCPGKTLRIVAASSRGTNLAT